jgi:hypothetical protein
VLTASTNNTVDTLTSVAGKRSGYVAAGAYHYYELFVGTSAATTYSVIVETCSGNADVYAAQDTFTPNSQDWRWKSEQVDSIDVVPVSSKQGFTLHVGVLAAQGFVFICLVYYDYHLTTCWIVLMNRCGCVVCHFGCQRLGAVVYPGSGRQW